MQIQSKQPRFVYWWACKQRVRADGSDADNASVKMECSSHTCQHHCHGNVHPSTHLREVFQMQRLDDGMNMHNLL